jgi:hypothetical protein
MKRNRSFPSGATKNTMVVYAGAGDQVKVTADGTAADGKPVQTEWTGMFDGKDYPLSGDPNADSRSYTKINDHTLELTNKKSPPPAAPCQRTARPAPSR